MLYKISPIGRYHAIMHVGDGGKFIVEDHVALWRDVKGSRIQN